MRQHLVSVHSKNSDDFSVIKSDDNINFTQNVMIKTEIAEWKTKVLDDLAPPEPDVQKMYNFVKCK